MLTAAPATALHAGFLASAEAHPQRPALIVEGTTYSYAEL